MTDLIQQHFEQPTHCPYCGSSDIDGDCIEIFGQVAEQRMRCTSCGRPWWDRYHLRELLDEDEKLHTADQAQGSGSSDGGVDKQAADLPPGAAEERNLRQQELIPPEVLNRHTAAVIGVGAIGRQVAIQLAAIGVPRLILIDPDHVETVNLGPQGFMEADVNQAKVEATAALCRHINSDVEVQPIRERFRFSTDTGSAVFCCVDKIDIRRFIWRSLENETPFFVDGRMSGEVIRVLTAADGKSREHYPATLFAAGEAQEGRCTARSSIFTANIAAGLMVEQFSRWLRRIPVDADLQLNLLSSELTVTDPA